ncbi:BCCT family transporter [Pseudomonas azadiae]|uniref:BCCT family transporter n=1 Tax=Pseudomonas azadiae TaxID=2843612 RepID=A0ABS6P2N1_9PSED|nr:BCCT family transporter [Pseudomonas azadiae]
MNTLVATSFRTAVFSDGKWPASWTIFYWAWLISSNRGLAIAR